MNAKLRLAGVLGAAALAVPGAALVSSAVAADGGGSSSSQTTQQAPPEDPGFAPIQESQPDRQPQDRPDRDCPKDRDGSGSGGSSSGDGTAPTDL